jgi:hypothetical protein
MSIDELAKPGKLRNDVFTPCSSLPAMSTDNQAPRPPPVYRALDALDGCSNATGSPSPRKRVLDFVKNVVGCKHPNLRICVTSRPEQDIHTALGPLTPTSCRVSLHEEVVYPIICSHGRNQCEGGRLRTRYLLFACSRSELAECTHFPFIWILWPLLMIWDRFRWVYCQLDTLSRRFSPNVRRVPNDLPATLDDTYERTLQGILKEKTGARASAFSMPGCSHSFAPSRRIGRDTRDRV